MRQKPRICSGNESGVCVCIGGYLAPTPFARAGGRRGDLKFPVHLHGELQSRAECSLSVVIRLFRNFYTKVGYLALVRVPPPIDYAMIFYVLSPCGCCHGSVPMVPAHPCLTIPSSFKYPLQPLNLGRIHETRLRCAEPEWTAVVASW